MCGNDEYIDKSSVRVSRILNNALISILPSPDKVVSEKESDFK